MSQNQCSVLVVGAGPTGLFLTLELRRHGIACRLVEQASEPCQDARATGIQPRTLEILDQVGIVQSFLPEGVCVYGVTMFADGNRVISHKSLKELDSRFPHELSIPQYRTERLLLDRLSESDRAVERSVSLLSFEQNADRVQARLGLEDGTEQLVEVDYLVGCDGSHSTVRRQLGLHLEGTDYPAVYSVADVRIDGSLPRDQVTLYTSPTVGVLIVPLPDNRFLFASEVPEDRTESTERSKPTVQELQDCLDRAGPGTLRIHDPAWVSYYHCHKRLVPQYRVGRVFLAGDAAHVQSPAAGQGMNTGIQDGFNLAWKLALALRQQTCPPLLESYHVERHHIGRVMLELSDRTHRALYEHHPRLRQRVTDWFASVLTRFHVMHPPESSPDETGVRYPHSPIVYEAHPQQGGSEWQAAPRAGDRAPDVTPLVTTSGHSLRMFDVIREPCHHLFVFEGLENRAAPNVLLDVVDTLSDRYRSWLTLHAIISGDSSTPSSAATLHDSTGNVHRRYGATGPCMYLIRPDGYIGFRSPTLDRGALEDYLGKLVDIGDARVNR